MTIQEIAQKLVADKKGILATDERNTSMNKKFEPLGIDNTEENRRAYREMLFTTEGIGDHISGVIMFDETIRQRASDGHTFVTVLERYGILTGIKVDGGTVADGENGEVITAGLDGLEERLEEYKNMDASFTKWRAVIKIGDGLPTDENILKNAELLAQYAKKVQVAGMVPIVEPEVLMEGNHDIETCYNVTKRTLIVVFEELQKHNVDLSAILLKPNMVIAGKEWGENSAQEVAEKTIACFKETVPADVAGIVFLSGGQSEDQAAENLAKMEELYSDLPWELSFSFGRALQNSALETWHGKEEHVATAQEIFLARMKALHEGARENVV